MHNVYSYLFGKMYHEGKTRSIKHNMYTKYIGYFVCPCGHCKNVYIRVGMKVSANFYISKRTVPT